MAKTEKTVERTYRSYRAFPADMLRYDCCFPKNSESTREIERSIEVNAQGMVDTTKPAFMVTVVKQNGMKFTDRRWMSFGWYPCDASTGELLVDPKTGISLE